MKDEVLPKWAYQIAPGVDKTGTEGIYLESLYILTMTYYGLWYICPTNMTSYSFPFGIMMYIIHSLSII